MKDNYLAQLHLVAAIRDFFKSSNFHDVISPPMVGNPGMEVHIHPFEVISAKDQKKTNKFLHTSPEFWMKNLLSHGLEKIFTISYCFRDEPQSPWHRSQFLMLEWYRANEHYDKIMTDCHQLIQHCCDYLESKNIEVDSDIKNSTLEKMTIQEIFLKYLNIDILKFLEKDQIANLIKESFPDIPYPGDDCDWDDYFFLIFLNKIEPELKKYPFLILYNYPAQLAALSTINSEDSRVCDRFELYCHGRELANCFHELTEIQEQKQRFQLQEKDKQRLYNYSLPQPDMLYSSLERGLPTSSGIALGVERLLKIITKSKYDFILEN